MPNDLSPFQFAFEQLLSESNQKTGLDLKLYPFSDTQPILDQNNQLLGFKISESRNPKRILSLNLARDQFTTVGDKTVVSASAKVKVEASVTRFWAEGETAGELVIDIV